MNVLWNIFKDKEVRDKWQRRYIHWRNIYSKGSAETSFIKGLFNWQGYAVYWLAIRSIWPDFPIALGLALVPVIIALRVGTNLWVGLYWDKERIFDKEADWSNGRNPVMSEINKTMLNGTAIK